MSLDPDSVRHNAERLAELVQDPSTHEYAERNNRRLGLRGVGDQAYEETQDELDVQGARTVVLGQVPLTLQADDAVPQDLITSSISRERTGATLQGSEYHDTPLQPLDYAWLKRQSEEKRTATLQRLLHKKHRLVIGQDLYYLPDDERLQFGLKETRLDAEIRIPCNIGFGAILPRPEMVRRSVLFKEWSLTVAFDGQGFAFRGSRQAFPFDPAGRMLLIGHTGAGAQVYMTWMPKDAMLPDAPRPSQYTTRPTTMRSDLARVTWVLVAYFMFKSGCNATYLTNSYPNIGPDNTLSSVLSVLEQRNRKVMLNVEQLAMLNQSIVSGFQDWLDGCPPTYLDIPELRDAIPAAVYVKYGQDQVVCDGETFDADKQAWAEQYNMAEIHSLGVAITSHVTAALVLSREQIDPADLLRAHSRIYDTPYPGNRTLMTTVEDMNALDSNENLKNLYDADGYPIARTTVDYDPDMPCLALLADLRKTTALLFQSPEHSIYPDEDAEPSWNPGERQDFYVGCTLYAQALTQTWGQWQSHGVTYGVHKMVQRLSTKMARVPNGEPGILSQSSQGYNTAVHNARESKSTHVAQRGLTTGAAAGPWAVTPAETTSALKLKNLLAESMPWSRLDTQLSGITETYFRFENNHVIIMHRLKATCTDGGVFYEEMFFPLSEIILHPIVFEPLKDTLVAMKPREYVNMYKHVTAPLRAWQEAIWRCKIKPYLGVRGERPSPVWVEWIAIFDRLLNFAYTGAAKVLTHGAMWDLYLSHSVVDHGFPMLSKLLAIVGGVPTFRLEDWPVNMDTEQPKTVSQASQQYTYSVGHFSYFLTDFRLALAPYHPEWYPDRIRKMPPDQRSLHLLGEFIYLSFADDVKDFVKTGVEAEIKDALNDNTHPDHQVALDRRNSLKQWLRLKHFCGWGDSGGNWIHLIRALSSEESAVAAGLPPSGRDSYSLQKYAEDLIKQGSTTTQPFRAPLRKNSPLGHALRVCINHARQLLQSSSTQDQNVTLRLILVSTLRFHHVNFIPDVPPSATPGGPLPANISIHAWTRLGSPPTPIEMATSRVCTPREQTALRVQALHDQEVLADVNTDWSINEVTLFDLHKFVNRQAPPIEFHMSSQSALKDEIKEVYDWAYTELTNNFGHWSCQLAFLLAYMLSRMLPNVNWTKGSAYNFGRLTMTYMNNTSLAKTMFQQIPWVAGENSNGNHGFTDNKSYFTCAIIVILSYMRRDSMFYQCLAADNKFHGKWTRKHGSSNRYLSTPLRLVYSHTTAPKALGTVNWYRIGLCNTGGNRFNNSGSACFNKDYHVFEEVHLQQYYMRLRGHLSNLQVGPYLFALEVVGAEGCKVLTDKGLMKSDYTMYVEPVGDANKLRKFPNSL
ncbi:uncharacterized protein BXZ73DRAFT_81168 [Epithele typhae]|uniref:uncharacterized protein n=1 Tax=Epithele typhae TaxID=378194 RepID=UPI0020084BA2|nr:uncharacterized protein BXZ73DRAFT_81168 [Epithele typhae]KAH9916088.1 hypothetical protein BXZ73DRAFT_81168 [Epithele typhae]